MLQYFIIFSILLIPSNASYDYYKLSQQWPPTFCAANTCKSQYKKLNRFTIHGLWPSNYTGALPTVCSSSNPMVPVGQIPTTLNSALVSNWPNLKIQKDDHWFWSNEWIKHGRCSSFSNSPLDYFRLALSIQSKHILENILTAKFVHNKSYPKNQYNMTIFNSIGAYPQLRCLQDPKKNYHLLEIRLCSDHSGASYINCTDPSNTCGTNIIWPL